jgi:uncharacterized protein (DUF983 family)
MPASERDDWRACLRCPECRAGRVWWLPIERLLECDTCGLSCTPAEVEGTDDA